MATKQKAGGTRSAAALSKTTRASFEPFQWTTPGTRKPLPADRVLETVNRIRDLTAGTTLVLQLLEQSCVAQDLDGEAMFTPADAGTLLRFAIVTNQTAAQEAEELDSWAFKNYAKEA